MNTPRHNTTIRLSDEERTEIEETMKVFGFSQLAPFIRFALKQLKKQHG